MFYNFYSPEQFREYFTPEFYIDTVQNLKRNVTDKVITDKTLNKAAHDYINAQTAFAKTLSKNTLDLTQYSMDAFTARVFPKAAEDKPKAKSL